MVFFFARPRQTASRSGGCGVRPGLSTEVRMAEKRKKPIQVFDYVGDSNLNDCEFLQKREAKFQENIRRRREELRRWLEERGMIPKGK